jgi:hypothetical protein
VKTCEYCGRENKDESSICHECGTPLNPVPVSGAGELVELDLPGWVTLGLKIIALFLLLISLYFLSFGPVARYCGTRKTTAIPGVFSGAQTSVRYPAWVGVVYGPALSVAGKPKGLYARYVSWWQSR